MNIKGESTLKICEQKFNYLNYSKRTKDNYLSHINKFLKLQNKSCLHSIENGKKNWNMKVFQKYKNVKVESDTIQTLINLVIENTWVNAKNFYENEKN